jgi:adenylylsulfate kinase-like enzyme
LADEGALAVVAATAHEASLRRAAHEVCGSWFLIHARCPARVCEERDPKALYRTARAAASGAMSGVHVEFEEPEDADLVVDTDREVDVEAVANAVLRR